ncbi:LamG-like jellyroll fold domain-containing protein [Candidatus Nitrosotenuis chungbukensis]|uniref:LamG-like jellyroll fold domain-containing protein n=1 Tax=Candidatus Nitrosotenuis chungbukensis TaxID=1353246 RepID=UPI0026735CCC|nr:LamG-like jellyroll fold domain-containing protein [Candidatus Nitrosotenuis chungbukensis]WKT58388.1 LamG-like jellyroll fold domain-containing protein [Candidatus Nitrosotenuis chungbukensis]
MNLIKKPAVEYTSRLSIMEQMTVSNNDGSDNQIYLLKHNNNQAILERVFNQRKFNFDKISDVASPFVTASAYHNTIGYLSDSLSDSADDNFEQILSRIQTFLTSKSDVDLIELQPVIYSILTKFVFDDVENNIQYVGDSFEQQSSSLLFIFAVVAFYIMVRSENPKIRIQNYNRILSLVFISILLSSGIASPISISKSYWIKEAYADHSDQTPHIQLDNELTSDPQSTNLQTIESTVPANVTQAVPANVTQAVPANVTQAVPANVTQAVPANVTQAVPANVTQARTSQRYPSCTSQRYPSSYQPTLPKLYQPTLPKLYQPTLPKLYQPTLPKLYQPTLPKLYQPTLPKLYQPTLPKLVPANATITIPNATQSWAFNKTVNGSQFIGDVNLNQTGLIFDGGFVKSAGNYTNQTSNIAITAWIKPDYSSGSSMFTIVSKENSFELTLDNISENVATFSIFDGIKWHSVSTVSEIGQGWSHVAATFNGTDISIYTNGTISSTEKTIQTVSVSSEGTIENTIPQVSSTDTDVVIGATLDARAVDKAQKVFSGGIDQLEIYDRYLTAEQIHEIYTRTLPIILAKYVNNTTIQTVEIPPISLLNQTSVNGTLNTNSTEYVIVPTVNQTSQMTISTWVTPQYNGAAAELTILSKEGSFVLSLNNVISPEHAAKFAVFDGIRWTAAQGTNKIHDKSHVVAVINGTEISLYVNGVLQERQTLPKSFIISEDDLVVSEVADSESDIVIGAYISTVRSEPKLSNKFSGVISDVVVYSKALEQDEIKQLYHSISNTELSLFESLEVSDSVYSKLDISK